MSLKSLLLLIIGIAVLAFVGLNWAAMNTPTDLNLGFTEIRAPLGLVLLGLMAALSVVFVAMVAYTQGTVLVETRRHAKELAAQRELADKAEASRFTDLRAHLDKEMTRLTDSVAKDVKLGGWNPGVSFLRRDGEAIVRLSDTEFGPGDDFCVVYHLFDLAPGYDLGWSPRYRYDAAAS